MKSKLPKNESGNRKAKLWQTLSVDTGIAHLDRQITTVLTLMQISANKDEFENHFDRLFGKLQLRLQVLSEMKELTA